ncbi:MAG: hypothetical protein NE327_12060, partial [Lentisphaeraceae bacterium]|nr:hypothetical protein [Lentisphaeraceae bacterium]
LEYGNNYKLKLKLVIEDGNGKALTMKRKILVLFICLFQLLISCKSDNEIKYNQIQNVNGIMEVEANVSLRPDSDGSKVIVISVKNNTTGTLWLPGFYPMAKNLIGCESINLSSENELGESIIKHLDYGPCEFPRSYTKILSGDSVEYLLDSKYLEGMKNNFKIEIWAPWRLENSQFVDNNTKKTALGKDTILIERIVGTGLFLEN